HALAKSRTPTTSPDNNEGGHIQTGENPSRIDGTGPGIVAIVVPGGPAETTSGAENVTAPSDGSEAKPQAQQPDPAAPAPASDPAKASTAAGNSDPPKTEGTGEASGTTDEGAKSDGAAGAAGKGREGGGEGDSIPDAGD